MFLIGFWSMFAFNRGFEAHFFDPQANVARYGGHIHFRKHEVLV